MKFRDGYWGMKKGIKLLNPVEVRDIESVDGSLTVYASCKRIRHRGDTLNAPMITTTYSSPMPDIIRVRSFHFKGTVDREPKFEIVPDSSEVFNTETTENAVLGTSGDLSVTVETGKEWATRFSFQNRHLTEISGKHSGYIGTDSGECFMSEHLGLSVGETVYGLGERFTPFVKNGQVVDIWNEDGGTSSEQAYKNIPFYISNRGYGVLVAHSGKVSFEVASEVVTSVQFSVPGESLEYYVIGGDSIKDVLINYAKLTGKPALPPAWSFGLWLTTSFTTDYNEATVNQFVQGMADRDIPLHVFHFDCFWMKEFQWVDFEWDSKQFPDPHGMIQRLKTKGLKICVWINPYVAQKSKMFTEGQAKGYLVTKSDGSVWQWDRWQAGMGLVDFTNPDAVSWFQSALGKLLDMGVDTFKTDFGERIPTDVVYANGADPVKMHNYYTYLYNKAVFELVEEFKGKNEALVFARSATVGSQKFPVHWGGDCSATYESMAESLRGGLSLTLSGFGFWSHDIGGFEQTATPDLFKRWIAFGMLSSHSRLHGSDSYRVPWNFDEESSDVLGFFVRLKCSMMPYLYSAACFTAESGIPMMRAMVLEFPDDPSCSYLDRQYMLGDSILVAPIFSKEGLVSYYLPEGVWTNFLTNEKIVGGTWRKETHGYKSLPLMVRENSIVPVGNNVSRPDYEYSDNICFHLFDIHDGAKIVSSVRNPGGVAGITISIERAGSVLRMKTTESTQPWSLCLRGVRRYSSVSSGTVETHPKGLFVSVEAGTSELTLVL